MNEKDLILTLDDRLNVVPTDSNTIIRDSHWHTCFGRTYEGYEQISVGLIKWNEESDQQYLIHKGLQLIYSSEKGLYFDSLPEFLTFDRYLILDAERDDEMLLLEFDLTELMKTQLKHIYHPTVQRLPAEASRYMVYRTKAEIKYLYFSSDPAHFICEGQKYEPFERPLFKCFTVEHCGGLIVTGGVHWYDKKFTYYVLNLQFRVIASCEVPYQSMYLHQLLLWKKGRHLCILAGRRACFELIILNRNSLMFVWRLLVRDWVGGIIWYKKVGKEILFAERRHICHLKL